MKVDKKAFTELLNVASRLRETEDFENIDEAERIEKWVMRIITSIALSGGTFE